MLTSIFNVGGVIDRQWQIHAPNEVPIEVRHTAYNHLTFLVGELAVRARTCTAPMRETFGGQLPEIDVDVLHKARADLSVDDTIVANYIATGSVWGQVNKHNAGDDADHHCLHCGAPNQDVFHIICDCPALKPTRDKHLASNLGGLDLSKLPKPLLLGLPPALCPNPTHTYWGQSAEQIGQCSREVINSFGIKSYPKALSEFGLALEGYVDAMSQNGFSPTNLLN